MDSQYLYVGIEMFSRSQYKDANEETVKGLIEQYGFRISTDPDGRSGFLLIADQPELKNVPNTTFGPLGTFGYQDTNGDVGGAANVGPTGVAISREVNADEGDTLNGYDQNYISDGVRNGTTVLWVRINPTNPNMVEFAIDITALNISSLNQIKYLDLQAIKGGPKDPQNYFWKDKYFKSEAGTPYDDAYGNPQNIYELDTLRMGPLNTTVVPEPSTTIFAGAGLACIAWLRRRRAKR